MPINKITKHKNNAEVKEPIDTEEISCERKKDNQYKVLPKSPIGKAIGYFLNQWKKLSRVLEAGKLQLDNNQIEHKIRPLALGRKNYLFADNHQAGQNIGMVYSFFATCKEHNINPYDWLNDVLEKIAETSMIGLEKLLPQNWSPEED